MQENSSFNINNYFDKLKDLIIKLGYENSKVSIDVAISLYEKYGEGLSEESFAKNVLNVSIKVFKKAKKEGRKILILKKKDTISDDKIINLKNRLIELGYAMTNVNRNSFFELYNQFGKNLTDRTFAINVLGISYQSYKKLRECDDYKVIVLKNSGDIETVKNKLIEDGYVNYVVKNYLDFLNIYQKYGYSFDQTFFATNILGLSYDDFRSRMKKNKQIKILPTLHLSIDQIVNILKDQGLSNKKINYHGLLEIYKVYSMFFNEKEFAIKVLKLTLDQYKLMKYKNGSAYILKEEKINDKTEIIKKNLVENKYLNKAIDYDELKDIYLKYGKNQDYEEKEFALDVLELSLDAYRALRRINNADKFKILKNQVSKELERLHEKFVLDGYSNTQILYKEFQQLHLKYAYFVSERRFAYEVLEINPSTYQTKKKAFKKNENITITILPLKKLSDDEIKTIKKELIEQGYEEKKLSLKQINDLHFEYAERVDKRTFFEKILGIYNIYENTKFETIKVLAKKDILTDNEIEDIKNIIYKAGYYYKKVTPDMPYELYTVYGKGLTFRTFIEKVLGITNDQIVDARSHNGFVRIIDINKKNAMDYINNNYLNEIRYYTKEEIVGLCKKYNLDLDSFILYSLLKTVEYNHETYIQTYKDILNAHNQLWIGNDRVSNDTINKFYYEIEDKIYHVIASIEGLYPWAYKSNQDRNDDFQELLLFFIENGSEIERNFMVYGNSDWERYLFGKLKRRMIIKVFGRIVGYKNETASLGIDNDGVYEKDIKDEKTNTESSAIENLDGQFSSIIDNCILSFGQLLLEGMDINEAKTEICSRFQISLEELVSNMQMFALNHNVKNFDLSILGAISSEKSMTLTRKQ